MSRSFGVQPMLNMSIYCYTWLYVRVSAFLYKHDDVDVEEVLKTTDVVEEVVQVTEHTVIGV
jgi:hypothetical protein